MTTLARFMQNCRDICDASPHVALDHDKITALAATFKDAAKAPAWNDYISDTAKADPLDMTRVLFEMAMICAQQGGFIYPDDTGAPQKWNVNGSGAAAMLKKMDELRQARVLPGIDIQDAALLQAAIEPRLAGVPSKDERLVMFAEFCAPETYAKLDTLVKNAWQPESKTYNFDFAFVNGMAALFPQSFETDAFRKKAILAVLMTAAHADTRGVSVTTDAPVAADYVLPQVLEGLGVLKLSPALRDKLTAREGFDENDTTVRDLRAATITACDALAKASGAKPQEIDSHLWLAGRDPAVKPKLLPAMNVYTTWF